MIFALNFNVSQRICVTKNKKGKIGTMNIVVERNQDLDLSCSFFYCNVQVSSIEDFCVIY
jgi:hypothetical protein